MSKIGAYFKHEKHGSYRRRRVAAVAAGVIALGVLTDGFGVFDGNGDRQQNQQQEQEDLREKHPDDPIELKVD